MLPETYKFPRGTSREQVIARMQQAQKRALAEIWERRNTDIPIKSPEQLVTLASIVEKETGKADERRLMPLPAGNGAGTPHAQRRGSRVAATPPQSAGARRGTRDIAASPSCLQSRTQLGVHANAAAGCLPSAC